MLKLLDAWSDLSRFGRLLSLAAFSNLHKKSKHDPFGMALHEAAHAVVHFCSFPNSSLFLSYDDEGAACNFKLNEKDINWDRMTLREIFGMIAFSVAGMAAEVLHGNTYEEIADHCQSDQKYVDLYLNALSKREDALVLFAEIFKIAESLVDLKMEFPEGTDSATRLQVYCMQYATECLIQHDVVYKEIANLFYSKGYIFPSKMKKIWSARET